jgi:uncharacterized NAD(P)/FAD-binding protein YdhS
MQSRVTVAIVGGGFSGAIMAAQLLRQSHPSFSVAVVEKTPSVGRGLAYGTDCDSLLLNVRARNLSAFPDDPQHFLRWAQSNYDPATGPGSFLPRAVYGHYVQAVLNEAAQSTGKPRLEWIRGEALTLSPTGDGAFEIHLRGGRQLLAGQVVLAMGNPPPGDPLAPWDAGNGSRYFRDPWSADTLEGVDGLSNILLVGSGLTSVDVAIQLRIRSFRGTIHLVSRHGLLPQPHKATDACPPFWNESSPKSIRGLLSLVRKQMRQAEEQGIEWQSVFDSLRPLVARIWQSLPEAERRRFLRHVRPYWEVYRHRAAPQITQSIAEQISAGHIKVHAGRITDCAENQDGVKVTYRNRKSGAAKSLEVDRVINCTGPESDCRRLENPLMAALLASGMARPDPLFLGLDVSLDGALIGRDGKAAQALYAVGPARKGSLWESTAVPELREQIHRLAQHLINAGIQDPVANRESVDSLSSDAASNSLISQVWTRLRLTICSAVPNIVAATEERTAERNPPPCHSEARSIGEESACCSQRDSRFLARPGRASE